MKRYLVLCAVIGVCVVCSAFAQGNSAAGTSAAKPATVGFNDLGPLTDDQIASLQTEWTDEKTKRQFVFTASFGPQTLKSEDKARYQKMGRIPYRLTADLMEAKETDGKKLYKRVEGSAKFYILDPAGKVVEKRSSSLAKMCPS